MLHHIRRFLARQLSLKLHASIGCGVAVVLALLVHPVPASASAQTPVVLDASASSVTAWPSVRMLVEPAAGLDPRSALERLAEFTVPEGYPENLGRHDEAIWLHVPVQVAAGIARPWILDVNRASIDKVDVFLFRDGNLVQQAHTGTAVRLQERPRAARTPSAVLDLQPGARHELLLRVQSATPLILPIGFLDSEALHAREARMQLVQGLLAGITFCLLLYTIGHWVMLREVMFLYYMMVLIGTGMFFFSYNGLSAQHLWGEHVWLGEGEQPGIWLVGGEEITLEVRFEAFAAADDPVASPLPRTSESRPACPVQPESGSA